MADATNSTEGGDERLRMRGELLEIQAKRGQKALAANRELEKKLLELLGVTREELVRRAEADYELAQAEAGQHLKRLGELRAARTRGRGPLRTKIEAAFEGTKQGGTDQ